MRILVAVAALLVAATSVGACRGMTHTETAPQSSALERHDDDVFLNAVVGFSLRKPPSWRFGPTAWGAARLDQLEFKDDEFAALVLQNATEPLVVVVKYDDTIDALSPVFRATFRPLGELSHLRPEQIADLLIPQFRESLADFSVVRGVSPTEISGHPAAHFASSFTVDDLTGTTHPIVTETWMVKRGDYVFILGTSAPSQDPSHEEFEAILRSISIDPGRF